MTITSKEVAEMLGKRHDNLLRAIRKYITQLGDEAPKYFSEDPDKGSRLYHITKAGCDLMAGRIIGAQSEAFKTKYAPVFGEEAPVEVVEEKQEEPQEKAYTVEEVAQILGCSDKTIVSWETGKTAPKMEKAQELSDLYGIPLAYMDFSKVGNSTPLRERESEPQIPAF